MLKEHARLLSTGLLALELLIWSAAFFLAQWARLQLPLIAERLPELSGLEPNLALLATALGAWIVTSAVFGLRRSYRTRPAWGESWAIIKSGTLVFFGLLTVIFLGKMTVASRLFVLLFAFTGTAGVIFTRLTIRSLLLKARAQGFNFRTLAIVGSGPLAHRVADIVREQRGWGMKFIGFIPVDEETPRGPLLGRVEDIASIVDDNVVDEVIFAVDKYKLGELESAFEACEETGVNTRIVLNFFPHKFSQPSLGDLDGLPMLGFHATSNAQFELAFKRVFDIAVASFALVLGAPLFVLTALAIKLESKGPVLFVQERVGRNGRAFGMIKFRSMVANAEDLRERMEGDNELDGPAFKIKSDPRITRVGRFIRKTSIDEIPQFLNVLRGEMSVVGPRPPLQSEVARYARWQRRRLSVKPGLTCIWQVSGRNNVDFDGWMKMDMEYVDRWSLRLDFKLFLQTIPAVLFGRGAS